MIDVDEAQSKANAACMELTKLACGSDDRHLTAAVELTFKVNAAIRALRSAAFNAGIQAASNRVIDGSREPFDGIWLSGKILGPIAAAIRSLAAKEPHGK